MGGEPQINKSFRDECREDEKPKIFIHTSRIQKTSLKTHSPPKLKWQGQLLFSPHSFVSKNRTNKKAPKKYLSRSSFQDRLDLKCK